jgi:hypothetical protein
MDEIGYRIVRDASGDTWEYFGAAEWQEAMDEFLDDIEAEGFKSDGAGAYTMSKLFISNERNQIIVTDEMITGIEEFFRFDVIFHY